jgi:hypothetical protein
MDEWRDARQVDRFANVKGHFIATRVSGWRPLSPLVLARAISRFLLALQLPFLKISESMGNHDSKIVGADRVD